jgi:RNA polymerase sigma-70 factor (ECF subfamily)
VTHKDAQGATVAKGDCQRYTASAASDAEGACEERDPDMKRCPDVAAPRRGYDSATRPGWAPHVESNTDLRDFSKIVEEYYQRIYNVIYRMIEDREEAEDLTQDTFVNAHRALDTFRHESQVYTWLYRIAVNLTKNRLDRRRRRRGVEGPSLDAPVEVDEDEMTRQVEDWRHAPGRAAENAELERVLAREVTGLRAEYKEVVILRDYEDLSYEEIAQVVGCSVQAVKSRLFRARSVLRRALTDYLDEDL